MKELVLDDRNLYGMYATWHVPFWQQSWFVYGIAGIATLLGLWAFYRVIAWIMRRSKKRSFWDEAQRLCAALQSSNYTSQLQCKKAYGTITHLLKQAFALRYGVDSMGATDTEFLRIIQQKALSSAILEDVQAIVQGATMVKFANQEALQDQLRSHIALCASVITRIVPEKK